MRNIQLRHRVTDVLHVSTAELGTSGSSPYVEVLCGKYSEGHKSSIKASENKLGASEKEEVGESRSLLCDEVGVRVTVMGWGRWRLGELGSVHECGATQVVMFPPSTERVDLSRPWAVLGPVIPSGMKEYDLSSPLRAPSR